MGNEKKIKKQNNQSNNNKVYSMPDKYLEGGYYSEENKLKKEYITTYARKIAEDLDADGGAQKNNRSQIRKFYEYGLRIQRMLNEKENDISYVEAYIYEFKPKVTYACNRGVVTKLFKDFIDKNIEEIKYAKDYYAFMKHFECVIAYMKIKNK